MSKKDFKDNYLFMHKNIRIMSLNVNTENGDIRPGSYFYDLSHLPLGCTRSANFFISWWMNRAIPKSRKGSAIALRELGYRSTGNLLIDNLALSLTDCYWIKPAELDLTWEQVSLFRNNFVDIFGEITFSHSKPTESINNTRFSSATTQGELQKKWVISNEGKRVLIKGNKGSSYQQSLNEVFASELHRLQGFNLYTKYGLCKVTTESSEDAIGCFSYNYCSEDIEFISFAELLDSVDKKATGIYTDLKNLCINRYGFSELYFNSFIWYQILTDYIISNTDRHMNNIGILRNPDTLEWIGFAPIYDSGNSMFFRSQNLKNYNWMDIKTASFVNSERKLLRYVKNYSLIDLSKVPDFGIFNSIYSKDIPERLGRIPDMYHLYMNKVNYLRNIQK